MVEELVGMVGELDTLAELDMVTELDEVAEDVVTEEEPVDTLLEITLKLAVEDPLEMLLDRLETLLDVDSDRLDEPVFDETPMNEILVL
ncbi:hypothetical protein Slin15195_G003180 [Septoria linicola]|uniref:Uncharacterized protein n=1 Tax=Septoria linicola TaxID=215465 RepID=A0A9Q9ACG2_9PEZI|nr:hypothetical protein Slin14017_G003210 [Septoria linicola]USW46999.1 hypothetical protein Slin15195_G003180 [Septoria linicola]